MAIQFVMREKILAINSRYILAYYHGKIVLKDKETKKTIKQLRIHKGIAATPFIERIMRFEPRVACEISENSFMYTDHGAIYEYDCLKNNIKVLHKFRHGMNNPLTLCVRKEEGRVKNVLYGDYIWNEKKGPVSIYCYDLKKWEKIYTFPSNSIKHVHNIIYNDNTNKYIVLTGDDDNESGFWEADEEFRNVKLIIGENQKYRSCVCWPQENGKVVYATDTPLEDNSLFLLDDTKKIHEIYNMPGPCIFGMKFNNKLYLSTSVEGDPTEGKWRYRFSYKLGRGVQDRYVHIIVCDNEFRVRELAKFKKDILPMWLCQFGNAQFVCSDDEIFFTLQGTKKKGTYKLYDDI